MNFAFVFFRNYVLAHQLLVRGLNFVLNFLNKLLAIPSIPLELFDIFAVRLGLAERSCS